MSKGKRRHRWNVGRILLIVLIVTAAYSVLSYADRESALSVQLDRQQTLLRQQAALEHQLEYHENELDFIGTDEYVEQEARIRLGWLKEGEIKYMDPADAEVPREKITAEPTPTPSVPGPRQTPTPVPAYASSEEPSSSASAQEDASSSNEEGSAQTGSPEEEPSAESTPEPTPEGTPKSVG